ncbi:MAG: hypothetical protein H8E32_05115 [Nitrospinae bacterium]|nr:hypothetical protein [Nitrospinota bacterium]
MVDSDIKRLTCGINAILNRLSGQMATWWIPPMLKSHPPQSDHRNFFIGFSKTPVFHPESMSEPHSVIKKIIEVAA